MTTKFQVGQRIFAREWMKDENGRSVRHTEYTPGVIIAPNTKPRLPIGDAAWVVRFGNFLNQTISERHMMTEEEHALTMAVGGGL